MTRTYTKLNTNKEKRNIKICTKMMKLIPY